jgi:DNA-binding NtrC family response regulator
MYKLLIIDDQAGMRRSLAILLRKEGYQVEEAENGEHAVTFLESQNFDLVITDLKMSPGTGLDILFYMTEKQSPTNVIIMTGYGTVDSAVLAMKMGAFDYISKPFKNEEILHRVNKAITSGQTNKEITLLKKKHRFEDTFMPIIGKSRMVKELIALVKKIASRDLPVLITGETGTGKSLVAKTLHSLSQRASKPYISLNCAAVPEHLLESELFGHKKGAFTGAILDRTGLFQAAEGGSLLLDEIGSMQHSLQVKLLDVLQEMMVRPVGSNQSQKINVRMLAATNIDLEQAIRMGKFREDLYYRVKVAHIHISPLREHMEDVPVLAQHFLDQFKKEFNQPDLHFADDAFVLMQKHDYPGNIRELNNLVSSAAAIAPGPAIFAEDVSLGLSNRMFDVSNTIHRRRKEDSAVTLEEKEKELIQRCIRKHTNNLANVCEELGISRTTLWRRMKEYGIE